MTCFGLCGALGPDVTEVHMDSCIVGPGSIPEGPSTQYLRTLVPKAIKGMILGTRVLKSLLGPSGYDSQTVWICILRALGVPD